MNDFTTQPPHSDEDLQIMQENIKHMKVQYLWPKRNSKNLGLKFIFCFILTVPCVVCIWLHLFATLLDMDKLSPDYSEDIAMLSTVLGLYQILIGFVWKRENVEKFLKGVGSYQTFGQPDNFEKCRQWLNNMIKYYYHYIHFSIISFAVIKFFSGQPCERTNEELGLNELCGMMTPAWAPFDVSSTPRKLTLFGFQFFATLFLCKGAAAVTASIFEVSEYMVLKIRHLRRLLTEIFDDPRKQVQRQNLIFCIKYHQHIISLLDLFNKLYRQGNGCYVVMVGVILASVANQFMREHSIGNILHILSWIVIFYISCHAGQSLLTESLKIPIAAFESKWYEASLPLQKDLLVLIIRSQEGFYFQAAPVGTMTFEFFVAVSKSSYSYFTFLNQMT